MQKKPEHPAPPVPEKEKIAAHTTRYRPPQPHNLDDDIKRVQKSWSDRWSKR